MAVPHWLTITGETVVRKHHKFTGGTFPIIRSSLPRLRRTSGRMIDRSRSLRSSACSERGGSPQVSGKLFIGLRGLMGCEPANPTRPYRKWCERHSSLLASCFRLVFGAGSSLGNPTSTEFAVTVRSNGLQNRLFSKSDPSTNGGNVK